MRCAAKSAENAAIRLRSAAAGETGSPEAADASSSAASATQPAAVVAARARGDAPRDIGDYELELIYSGESDGQTNSKESKAKEEPELAKPEPTTSASRSALSFADRRDIFGSSDESDPPSPRRSRSAESERSHWNDLDGDAIMHQVRVIRMILVSVLLSTPDKRLWIATSWVLLLRRSRGYLLRECWLVCLKRRVTVTE
uniref:RxLR effector candidate protein n=1 Tax=Hyaloperonospora arabidopsidis (strain Emoy2) TaxID=559515 RepID=M4BYN2_HYAAE